MRSLAIRVLAMSYCLAIFSTNSISAQETTSKSGAKKDSEEIKGRLPNNYKSLELTDEQKQKIYRIQSEVRPKIDALERQAEALQEKMYADIEAVLTDDQRTMLRKLKSESAAKTAEKKTKKVSKKTSEAK